MSGVRAALKTASALPHYLMCRVMGIQGTYKHRGGSPISVYMMPDKSSAAMRQTLGARVQEITRQFEISSANPGFPPADGVMEDDVVTDDLGLDYAVRRDDSDELDAVLVFTGVCTTPKQSGQLGQ